MGRGIMILVLATGGFPLAMFLQHAAFLEALGGFHSRGAQLIVSILLVLLPVLLSFGKVWKECLQFPFLTTTAAYALLTLMWAPDWLYGVRFALKVIAPFLFVIGFTVFLRVSDLQLCERIIFVLCAAVIALAVVNVSVGGIGENLGSMRAWGVVPALKAPTTAPSNFSFFVACGALLALGNYYESKKVKFVFLFILYSTAVLFAYTRVSMVGLFISAAMMSLIMIRSSVLRIGLPLVLVCGVIASPLLSSAIRERMFYHGDKMSASDLFTLAQDPKELIGRLNTSGRGQLWERASQHFVSRDDIFGAGVGSVEAWTDTIGSELHSEYFRMYIDCGEIGLILFILSHLNMFLVEYRILRRNHKSSKKYAAIGASAMLFYVLTLLTDNSINYVNDFSMYVMAFIAFSVIVDRASRKRQIRNAHLFDAQAT